MTDPVLPLPNPALPGTSLLPRGRCAVRCVWRARIGRAVSRPQTWGALPWPPRPSTRRLERAIPLLGTPCFRRRRGRLGESPKSGACPPPATGLCRMAEIRFCPARLLRAKPPRGCASPKPCGRTLAAARRKRSTEGIRRGTRPKAKRFEAKSLKPEPAQNKISSGFFENGVFLGSYSDRRRPALEMGS